MKLKFLYIIYVYGLYSSGCHFSLAKPSSPTQLKVISYTWGSIELEWKEGYDGGCPQSFLIETQQTAPGSAGNITKYNLTGMSLWFKFMLFTFNDCYFKLPLPFREGHLLVRMWLIFCTVKICGIWLLLFWDSETPRTWSDQPLMQYVVWCHIYLFEEPDKVTTGR